VLVLLAVTLSGCGDKPQPQAVAAPPVTVAQPTKRTVTDWDEFTGRFEAMDFLDNRLDLSTGTLRGRAIVPNKDFSILPGQFGRVRLIGSAPYEALLLPDTAIATDQSRKIVFVVKDDDTVEARPVILGPLDDGLRVIREGLKPDDRVIVEGLQRARVGAKVSPHAARSAPAGGKT
jgi:RND family efflux transporter MFP subunit